MPGSSRAYKLRQGACEPKWSRPPVVDGRATHPVIMSIYRSCDNVPLSPDLVGYAPSTLVKTTASADLRSIARAAAWDASKDFGTASPNLKSNSLDAAVASANSDTVTDCTRSRYLDGKMSPFVSRQKSSKRDP